MVAQKIATTGTPSATAICMGPLSFVIRTLHRLKAAGSLRKRDSINQAHAATAAQLLDFGNDRGVLGTAE